MYRLTFFLFFYGATIEMMLMVWSLSLKPFLFHWNFSIVDKPFYYYFVTLTLIYIHFNGLSIHIYLVNVAVRLSLWHRQRYIYLHIYGRSWNDKRSSINALTFDWLTDLFGMWNGKIGSKHHHTIHGSMFNYDIHQHQSLKRTPLTMLIVRQSIQCYESKTLYEN